MFGNGCFLTFAKKDVLEKCPSLKINLFFSKSFPSPHSDERLGGVLLSTTHASAHPLAVPIRDIIDLFNPSSTYCKQISSQTVKKTKLPDIECMKSFDSLGV